MNQPCSPVGLGFSVKYGSFRIIYSYKQKKKDLVLESSNLSGQFMLELPLYEALIEEFGELGKEKENK